MELEIGNKNLSRESNVKYLGIYIDEHLNWKEHISITSKKVSKNIGILSKIRHFVSQKILTSLYYSLIYPFFYIWLNYLGKYLPHYLKPHYLFTKKSSTYYDLLEF